MQFRTKKELKMSILLHFLIVFIAFVLLVFNLDSLYVFALFFKEIGAFISITFLVYMLFTMLLAMEVNEFIFRKLDERKKVKN